MPDTKMRWMYKSGVFWAMTLLLGWLGSVPARALEAVDETAASERSGDDDAAEGFLVEDEVFVEGRLPDIPTSNTVAAKLPLPLRETPASVTVIPTSLTEEQRGFILGDALENVSGVNVQTGNGVYDFFVIRGLDSVSSGLILTDGAPEPETTFYQLYNVDRVEVLKGPSAFLYGGSPLGGTVNLVRKQPEAERFTRAAGYGGSFGTFETTVDTNLASADGSLAFR
ncbi:MAG: TonB-dependent receptor plug domain-containing protein, partial [Acidobacteria bacterium]|nr:TonB-dependent receptor plug domain-containing protein [Acidobacteriota bacterium]